MGYIRSAWKNSVCHFAATVILLFFIFPCQLRANPVSDCSIQAYLRTAPDLIEQLHHRGLTLGKPVFIRIFKLEKILEIWVLRGSKYDLFKTYPICSYSGVIGPKLQEGDNQGPEGFYSISTSRLHPFSTYHLAFNLGYPNRYDRNHQRTGSALMVHGRCSSAGCYAMTDNGIEEIYTLVDMALLKGQQRINVHIFPFHLQQKNLDRYTDSKWLPFWQNLKEGYDIFEKEKVPPVVTVAGKSYVFSRRSRISMAEQSSHDKF